MAAASSAALIAPGLPIARVPTGNAAGICTIENKESCPPSAVVSMGTPSTGSAVIAAVMPGRWAAPPAPAMTTLKPARLGALGESDESVWRPVRGDDQGRKADLELVEKGGGVPHRLPIRFAAHDNGDGLFYKGQRAAQIFDAAKAAA